jgi:hypothetical protein
MTSTAFVGGSLLSNDFSFLDHRIQCLIDCSLDAVLVAIPSEKLFPLDHQPITNVSRKKAWLLRVEYNLDGIL